MYKHLICLLRLARDRSPAGTTIPALASTIEGNLTQAAHGLRTRHSHLRHDAIAMTHWLVFSLRVLRRLRAAA